VFCVTACVAIGTPPDGQDTTGRETMRDAGRTRTRRSPEPSAPDPKRSNSPRRWGVSNYSLIKNATQPPILPGPLFQVLTTSG
jgi:hypothetical protein